MPNRPSHPLTQPTTTPSSSLSPPPAPHRRLRPLFRLTTHASNHQHQLHQNHSSSSLHQPSAPAQCHAPSPSPLAMLLRILSNPLLLLLSLSLLLSLVWSVPTSARPPNPYPSNVTRAAHTAALLDPAPATWQLRPAARSGRRLHADGADSDGDVAGPPEADLAYFVQISSSTLGHLPRLLDRIYDAGNHYALHFDRKMDAGAVSRAVSALYAARPEYRTNVHVMPSELITYRGVSMLLNTINAMRFLLDRDARWHYFVNLSGADYPVVSQTTMRRLLGAHIAAPLNFLSYAPRQHWRRTARYRFAPLYVDEALAFGKGTDSRVRQLRATNPLAESANFTLAHAEAWLIGSRELCAFVVNSGYARKLLVALAYSVEASEHYFATLAWNHPRFNRTIVPHALRHVVWNFANRNAGQHPFFVDDEDANGDTPLGVVVDRTPNLFIRKFRRSDSPLMEHLDAKWSNMTHLQRVRDHFAWAVRSGMREHAAKPPLRPEDDVDI